jgi:homocysteine S-methyltransferase
MANPLSPDDVLLLDGGLATELESMGHSLKHRLWSAKLLLEQPQAIIDAHLAYLRAGAQCIISASYQASFPGLMQFGLSRAEAVDVLLLSIDLARQAASQYCQETSATTLPLVAASIGPYGAFLADGAEYRGNYQLEPQRRQQPPSLWLLLVSGPTAPSSPTALNTVATINLTHRLYSTSTNRDWRFWLAAIPTCWPAKQYPASRKLKYSTHCWHNKPNQPGSAFPAKMASD